MPSSDKSLTLDGLAVAVPRGWEAELTHADEGALSKVGDGLALSAAATPRRILLHLANFALPLDRGDYGSGAVESMDAGAVFIALWEHERSAVDDALFRSIGLPSSLRGEQFSPDALQRRLPGQGGLQRFFQVSGRAFVLYVVIGSYRSRELLAPEVNRLLSRISIS